jgi:excisionase family DNA binding protein
MKKSAEPTMIGAGLLTIREVATVLPIHPSTVYGLCERGELAHTRVSNAIRISPRDVEAFIRHRTGDARS